MTCTPRSFLILLAFSSTAVQAQTKISGRILDKVTKQPVSFVSVALYQTPDSLAALSGAVTDSAGQYVLPVMKPGDYTLQTFSIGYKPVRQAVVLVRNQPLDLGLILLEADSKLLDEVQVSGQRADVIVQADRQTFRAAQFQSAAGGTATDVL